MIVSVEMIGRHEIRIEFNGDDYDGFFNDVYCGSANTSELIRQRIALANIEYYKKH